MDHAERQKTDVEWRSDGILKQSELLCPINFHRDLKGGLPAPTLLVMDLSQPAPTLFDALASVAVSAYQNVEAVTGKRLLNVL
jgi:hypothetical protein